VNALLSYDWPGNVRELRNVLERAMIVCDDDVIRVRIFRCGPCRRGLRTRPISTSSSVTPSSA
jgi:DNA-binding NtrC family response regulator